MPAPGLAGRDPNPGRGLRVEPERRPAARGETASLVPIHAAIDRMPSGCTSGARGAEAIADGRDRGFHCGVGVASLLVRVQPGDHRGVLTVELVAEAPARQRGVDRLAGEDRVDRLGSRRGRAPHPALSLGAVEVLGQAQRRVDVREQPRRAELGRDRTLLRVARMRGDQRRDPLPGSSVPEAVAADQGGERDAALRAFLRVGERRRSEAGGRWDPRPCRGPARSRGCSPRCWRGWPRRTRAWAPGRVAARRSPASPRPTSPAPRR